MENKHNLGIWMDHSTAQIIDVNSEMLKRAIKTTFPFQSKQEALQKGESHMHNKEQQKHKEYYEQIGDEILKFDHVLLFGPTNAKVELHNFLKKDAHFNDIQIDVEPSDEMTENQMYAFVRDHFDNNK